MQASEAINLKYTINQDEVYIYLKHFLKLQTAVKMQLKVKELHLILGHHFFPLKKVIIVIVTISLIADKARFLINQSKYYIKSVL